MSKPIEFPLPGDKIEVTVIASYYYGVDDNQALMLLLHNEAPYFSVQSQSLDTGEIRFISRHDNIVPAVDLYKDSGGDYY